MATYRTPQGSYYNLYHTMADQPHLLIAGATGSGKSTVINGIITTVLHGSPATTRLILIDPKKVELIKYKDLPHVLGYVDEPRDRVRALQYACDLMDKRFRDMQQEGITEHQGAHVYVIVDELADLMTTQKTQVMPYLQRLAQLGRAARIHLVLATQCPLREIIPTAIKCNLDSRVALRTASAQDSRNILDRKGAELLPDPKTSGTCLAYFRRGANLDLYNIPRYSPEYSQWIIDWWKTDGIVST